jgi:hypothetical protein
MIGLDVSEVGEPDPVRRGGDEVALEQVRGDREVVTAIGGAHPSWRCQDGPDAVQAQQSLDATAAHRTFRRAVGNAQTAPSVLLIG